MSQILVRHAEPDDYAAIRDVFAQPKAVAGTLQLPLPSLEKWRKRIAETNTGEYQLVASISGNVVGFLYLRMFLNVRRRHAGTIGMAVHDAYQNKGIGKALMVAMLDLADGWLNLERIELTVFADNEPAIKLYRHFGFVVEGTLRQYAFRDGALVDVYSMARLRKDQVSAQGEHAAPVELSVGVV